MYCVLSPKGRCIQVKDISTVDDLTVDDLTVDDLFRDFFINYKTMINHTTTINYYL